MLGTLKKMRVQLDDAQQVQYQLVVGDELLPLNPLIGKQLTLTHTGNIFCCNCGKKARRVTRRATVLSVCKSWRVAICAS